MSSDWPNIIGLLQAFNLPTADLESGTVSQFLVAEEDEKLIGCIACERRGEDALFRSLAVRVASQNQGTGGMLMSKMADLCKRLGVKRAFILTISAAQFAQKHGFRVIERSSVPMEIKQTEEFRTLCPCTAICMAKEL